MASERPRGAGALPPGEGPAAPPLHGHGLGEDLPVLRRLMRAAPLALPRRSALRWAAASAGAWCLEGCGGGADAASGSTSTATSTATSTSTGTSAGSGSSTTASCSAAAQETNGPYPADGTNAASGATSDVLTASGALRRDIRSSFVGGSTATTLGVTLVLTINLVNTNAACAPLVGYAVYLWHCDRQGDYSLYTAPSESWLRGVQVSDANGQLSFVTVFPGCYAGRWPHIHFEVFASLEAATNGRNAALISQLAMPAEVCSAVYQGDSGYASSLSNLAGVSLARDGIFGDNTTAQMSAMTPAFSGSVSQGYSAVATIGLAR